MHCQKKHQIITRYNCYGSENFGLGSLLDVYVGLACATAQQVLTLCKKKTKIKYSTSL